MSMIIYNIFRLVFFGFIFGWVIGIITEPIVGAGWALGYTLGWASSLRQILDLEKKVKKE